MEPWSLIPALLFTSCATLRRSLSTEIEGVSATPTSEGCCEGMTTKVGDKVPYTRVLGPSPWLLLGSLGGKSWCSGQEPWARAARLGHPEHHLSAGCCQAWHPQALITEEAAFPFLLGKESGPSKVAKDIGPELQRLKDRCRGQEAQWTSEVGARRGLSLTQPRPAPAPPLQGCQWTGIRMPSACGRSSTARASTVASETCTSTTSCRTSPRQG